VVESKEGTRLCSRNSDPAGPAVADGAGLVATKVGSDTFGSPVPSTEGTRLGSCAPVGGAVADGVGLVGTFGCDTFGLADGTVLGISVGSPSSCCVGDVVGIVKGSGGRVSFVFVGIAVGCCLDGTRVV